MKGLCIVIAIVFVASVLGEDEPDCYPKPGERRPQPAECCSMQGFMPDSLQQGLMKCKDQFPKPPRPTGPPPTGPPPALTPEMKESRACMLECMFTEANLVNNNKALDEDAIKMVTSNNSEYASVMESAKATCLATYKKDIDPTLKCTSGAHEFKHCMGRETFKNCPASAWTASAECEALKAKVDKCPDMPIKMGPKGPHRHH